MYIYGRIVVDRFVSIIRIVCVVCMVVFIVYEGVVFVVWKYVWIIYGYYKIKLKNLIIDYIIKIKFILSNYNKIKKIYLMVI